MPIALVCATMAIAIALVHTDTENCDLKIMTKKQKKI